ncbi:lysoplasmalogenase [Pedobacter petrophilus]|uniref:Lysoplasmalogenase n=1 Tax=Pedobacter petrophilus TaxID=1908241 RepID=A0A7K0FWH6_9SPHI|nr:lysoplasmalogenase [Pedobacter petrophilus]MRX75957.1 lysoplasmalogenase [Pedobacter petrophilus]
MKTRLFTFIFAIIGIIHLYAEAVESVALRHFSKPLIVITLFAWLYSATNLKGRFHKRIFIGLIFSLTGDVILMYSASRSGFFSLGLVAFLLSHILYIRAFTLDHKSNLNAKNPFFLWGTGALIIFCIGLFFYLQPVLGAMQFAVLIYAIVITFMAIMALNRYGKVNVSSFQLILAGALFFLLSDSVLAINKFSRPIPQAGILIMVTYMIAQYLIVYGTVVRELVVKQTEV